MCSSPPSTRIVSRPGMRARLTICSASTNDCFISTTSAVPPAIGRAASPCSASSASASSNVAGAWNWKSRISAPRRRFGDRLDDLVVAGAAAEIAHHPVFDLVLAGVRVAVQQRFRRHDLARRADAALEAAVIDEGLLQRMQLLALGHALDRGDPRAVHLHGQRDAGGDEAAVEQHGAGATDADAARLLGAGEAEVVAQQIDQRAPRRHARLARLAVDREPDAVWADRFHYCAPPRAAGCAAGSVARPRCLSAAYTFSAVIGSSRMRTPIASSTALAIAGATGVHGASPMPRMWYGPSPSLDGSTTVLSGGMSRGVGSL